MLPDRVSNPGLLTSESGALPIALRGPAIMVVMCNGTQFSQAFIKRILHPIGFEPRLENERI